MRISTQVRWALAGLALAWSVAGCSTLSRRSSEPVFTHRTTRHVGLGATDRPGRSARPGSAEETAETDSALGFRTSHPQVRGCVQEFQTSKRAFMNRAMARGSKYVPEMTSILAEEGVPPELAYLPIIESGFRIDAVSPAGAVGPWQFIRATGQRYGLRIDGYVDERRDPQKATRAAARYLRDLYDMFGDWHLSLAAYNSGEGRIARIRDREQIDDYWLMSRNGHLPRETSQYVPRFIAAMEIATAPEQYGFDVVGPSEPDPFDLIHVDREVSLDAIARASGTSVATLRGLNPALRRGVVPPRGYTIRVPEGSANRFRTAIARLPRYRTHRVQRGESPGLIAKRYGVSPRALMAANGIRNPRKLAVGKVLRIPGPVDAGLGSRVATRRRGERPRGS